MSAKLQNKIHIIIDHATKEIIKVCNRLDSKDYDYIVNTFSERLHTENEEANSYRKGIRKWK